MMSSIESLDFSVASNEDVEITIKDVAGWHLDKAAPMVFLSLLFNFWLYLLFIMRAIYFILLSIPTLIKKELLFKAKC